MFYLSKKSALGQAFCIMVFNARTVYIIEIGLIEVMQNKIMS